MRIDKPLTQEQLKQGDLLENGIYDFEVQQAEEAVSKSGNEMIKLQVSVWDKNGRVRTLFDYLLSALEYKVGHFCEATGLLDKYQAGNVTANDCVGRSGKCKVYIQKSKDPQYSDKNAIADYMLTDEQELTKSQQKRVDAQKAPADDGFGDADIPF